MTQMIRQTELNKHPKMIDIRCPYCNKMLGKFQVNAAYEIKCPRCGKIIKKG